MKQLPILFMVLMPIFSSLFCQQKLKADYYNGTNFEEYVGSNYVSNLDFYWDFKVPIKGLVPDNCSVRYTGQLRTPRTGDIIFSARVDDGIRVWIDDQLIMSNWKLNDVGFSEGKIHMIADKNYTIKIEYFNAMREAELRLLWELPVDPNGSWLSKWWYGGKAVVISSGYFSQPIEEEAIESSAAIVEEKVQDLKVETKAIPIAQSKLKSQSEADQPLIEKSKSQAQKNQPLAEKPIAKSVSVSNEKSIAQPIQRTPAQTIFKPEPVVLSTVRTTVDTLQKYIPKNVEFERAKSIILTVSYPDLNTLASFLAHNPKRTVIIEGHTDNVGDSDKNLILSKERAEAIQAYLLNNGVDANQITSTKGFGGNRPLVPSDGTTHHPENRRVEFIIQ